MSLSPNLFLRVKPCLLLVLLKTVPQSWYVSSLARASGMTYVYATRLLSLLAQEGLVSFEPKGRVKTVRLTEKGLATATALDGALKALGRVEPVEKAEPVPERGKAEAPPPSA